jgi:hypothetical protein
VPIGTECNFLTTKLGSIPERGRDPSGRGSNENRRST